MACLPPLLLLLLFSHGSGQLVLNKTGDVTKTVCNQSILLPCYVSNLRKHSTAALFVEWKFNGQLFYSFDGSSNSTNILPSFSSANLSLPQVPKGDVSLTLLNVSQALEGNYTCDVTEVSRTGATTFSLKSSQVVMFDLKESVPIAFCLCLAVAAFWGHLGISFYKKKPSGKAIQVVLVVGGIILTVLLVVGLALLFNYNYSVASATGLGIAVIPTVGMVLVLQRFLYPANVVLLLFLALKILGFVIAVVGCGLCLATCPPAQAVLVLSGVVIFAAFVCADLVYSSLSEIIHSKTVV